MTDIVKRPEGCMWAVTKGGHSICQPPRSSMELEKQLASMQDAMEIMGKGNVKTLKQLAECQAREKVLRDALVLASAAWGQPEFPSVIVDRALALLPDSTALDTMLKQAQRETLLEAAEWFDDGFYGSPDNTTAYDLRRMAEELK